MTLSEQESDIAVDADYNAALCEDIDATLHRYLAANEKLNSAEFKVSLLLRG